MHRLAIEEPLSLAALWSRRVALFAVTVAAIGVGLTRSGRLDFPAALGVMSSAFVIAIAALVVAVLAFIQIWREGFRGISAAITGFIMASLLLAYPAFLLLRASPLPATNDVSTDLADPPAFAQSRAVLAVRGGHIPSYPSVQTGAAQRGSYPGLVPITLDRTADEAFAIASKAAQTLGWEIIETIPPSRRSGIGHLEAIDRSPVLRLPDDITIRVRALASGSRIDIRSASRYGWFDLGSNAQRIQRYAAAIEKLAKGR